MEDENVKPLKFLVWNIRAGGGKRISQILAAIVRHQPDVCGLSEFRGTAASQWLSNELKALGYTHQRVAQGAPSDRANVVFVASKIPLKIVRWPGAPSEPGRWLSVRLATPNPVQFCLVHIPNEVTGRKDDYLDAVTRIAGRLKGRDAIIAGDTNSGRPDVDEQSPVFGPRYTRWFDALASHGWEDSFRLVAGNQREYTWHSPQKDNGFRLDQAFISSSLKDRLTSFKHEWIEAPDTNRRDAVSDHAAMIFELVAT